jgi:hypothetical protein
VVQTGRERDAAEAHVQLPHQLTPEFREVFYDSTKSRYQKAVGPRERIRRVASRAESSPARCYRLIGREPTEPRTGVNVYDDEVRGEEVFRGRNGSNGAQKTIRGSALWTSERRKKLV